MCQGPLERRKVKLAMLVWAWSMAAAAPAMVRQGAAVPASLARLAWAVLVGTVVGCGGLKPYSRQCAFLSTRVASMRAQSKAVLRVQFSAPQETANLFRVP